MDTKSIIDNFKRRLNEDQSTKKKRRVALIIDDSEINREILSFYLQEEGYETFFAVNGREGVEKFNMIKPSITFLDIVMPRTSGLDALVEIKQADSDAIVIMVSSYVSKQNIQKAKANGADWFLMKPFTKEKLFEVINRFEKQISWND
ncbi:MAG: response regulator [Candidatus Cloacimonetes bacterium]|nr:response regulator [Candidatus Cloacimonadota bacterium]